MSSITGVSYAATIVTLAAGGLNPLLLGLASGLGISIGDTIYYFLGRQGRTATADTKLAYWGERFQYMANETAKTLCCPWYLLLYRLYTSSK